MFISYTESSLNKKVKHKDKRAQGQCGIYLDIWGPFLKERGLHYNSLKACVAVFEEIQLQEQSFKRAMKRYKGIKKNKKLLQSLMEKYNEL